MLKNHPRVHIYGCEHLHGVGGSPDYPPGQWKDT